MGATTPRGVPYPVLGTADEPGDTDDVPRDIQAIAEWVDENTLGPGDIESQVESLVIAQLAEDPTVTGAAASAVATIIDGRYLPIAQFDDEDDAYADIETDSLGRISKAVRHDGYTVFPAGLYIADVLEEPVVNDQFAFAMVGSDGRVAENAIGVDGRIPQFVLDAIASRISPDLWPFARKTVTTYVHVNPDGSGNYTTIGAALAAITDASYLKVYVVVIHPGTYNEQGLAPADWVFLQGTKRETCIINGYLPNSSTDAMIAATSTVSIVFDGQLQNLTIRGQNVRYPVHFEDAGNNPGSKVTLSNLHLEHLGNQQVIDYRTANPGLPSPTDTPSSVWSSWIAYGYGSGSAVISNADRVTFKGRSTYYVHNDRDFAQPMFNVHTGCRYVSVGGSGLSINPTGSGTDDEQTFIDCEFDLLNLSDQDSPWITTDPKKQYADHSEIHLTLRNCSPIGYVNTHRGKALRITSASTGTVSTVRVSGTAADSVFGVAGLPVYRDGGGGLQGYAYGYWDISGILVGINSDQTVGNTLGALLGDCSTSPKTLTVTVDGGSPIAVVFNTNLTAATNATIIATINTALGGAATAAEYLVGPGEVYPQIPDKTVELVNTGAVGIPRFAAVKYNASRRQIAIMQTGDPASAFLGVALQPIPPGVLGRVLVYGYLNQDQLFGYTGGSGGLAFGTQLSPHGSIPGAFAVSGSAPIATGIEAGWVVVKGNR